ncbi:MAG: 2-dehydropantoate 2-reductase [Verrucomicrobiales bacterium]|nr:2-dehydropantoate 2-reductase [Verrucomicrobiales bacterium]
MNLASRPKIAVVGCGALGSFYAARLARAGHEVHCLLRSDYDAVRARGLRVEDAAGGFTVRPGVAQDPAEIGPSDWVIIGLKTTANPHFQSLIAPLIGPRTAVLTLQNGLGNEERLAQLFGHERIFGGLCFVCLNRTEPGVVRHIAHGRIVMGEFGRPITARARTMAGWWGDAGIPCDLAEDLELAHWHKLVWNVPFNGLGVAGAAGLESVKAGRLLDPEAIGPCLATNDLLGNSEWEQQVRELMYEVIGAAIAQGMKLPEGVAEEQIERTREMAAYRASTLIDFERGLPLEIESLFAEPLRRGVARGARCPRLGNLCQLLRELEAVRAARSRAAGFR